MQSIINRIENNQFWKFHGGIHPPEQKFLTTNKPIRSLHLPEMLIIPIQQHIGVAGDICVNIGDQVLKGEALTAPSSPMAVPVHAPTSGTIEKIALQVIAHPSGLSELCIFLKPDHKDTWRERNICADYKTLARNEIVHKIAEAGISGMGGAGFPTHIKVDSKPNIDFLIINAAECEPYITADDLLMREHSATIVQGVNILKHLLIPRMVLIGIEDNKPDAIASLKKATESYNDIHICVLPTKYPTGGEKQLIRALTGKEITSGSLPIHQGIVMQNVATCFAIAEAVIHDTPLIKRVVTVSGQGLEKPQNIWAAIGTPVKDLVALSKSLQAADKKAIIMGGPMMGFTLPSDHVPIVKTTNCVLVPSEKELALENKEVECIRCGQCADVCPSRLLPQEMQWSAKAKDHAKLKELNLFDCIDCGACAFVCPSHIPLVQYYRVAKAEIRQQELLDLKAEKAKARFEARKARLEREKKERIEKQRKASEARRAAMEEKSGEGSTAKSAVAAALARVKAKKAQGKDVIEDPREAAPEKDTQKSQVAAAIARAKAKKAKAQQNEPVSPEENSVHPDEQVEAEKKSTDAGKSAKVAAAIAKAKAKKANSTKRDVETSETNKADDSKKSAKVSAAVAKAKAKKLQKEIGAEEQQPTPIPEVDKKANVAAAVAKAKAKKQQKEVGDDEQQPSSKPEVDKKAKVAAAVAKAKAKKTARNVTQVAVEKESMVEELQSEETTIETTTEIIVEPDDKKQRIANAIAKAKAKKQQAQPIADMASSNEEELPKEDNKAVAKKARIAAAVAKAKAKKQQESN
ncbi:electron transport complex subunit RsxC [Thalassotalea sp. M1531]|uniref:Ion-translocating oxidoreductase complex subunit C n=1 Tax=Thalassotalea algicola TaxID=2716224 RepID=A0A7Y0Q8C1_9GAMM|nr:electron transport complex subunit RsxC [Thalassotalea algicola]NMP32762.1 electron transport complex subunit RsxC [Thalassotalea algicola]